MKNLDRNINQFEPQPSISCAQINRKRGRKRLISTSCTSSNSSVEMSQHSDSDIIECSPESCDSNNSLQLLQYNHSFVEESEKFLLQSMMMT